jgi:hypothetical protein
MAGTPRGIKDTITRLETTLLWRRTEGLDDIAALSKCVDDPVS